MERFSESFTLYKINHKSRSIMPVKERTMTELKTFFLRFLKYSAHSSQICVDIWIITGFFYQLYGPSSCPDSQMSIHINDSHPQDKRAYSKNAIDRKS